MLKQTTAAVIIAVSSILLLSLPWAARADDGVIAVKIQAINDLHGGIDTGRRVGNRPVGGAGNLAAQMKQRAAGHPHVLRVGAGDMVGGSPSTSALLQDEPTIRVLNALGLLVNSPGNHEFDEGIGEFFRLTNGGCHPVTGCFEGARFKQISANILVDATGESLLAPYHIELVDGVPIGFIGATHADVARVVVAGAVDGLHFADPAASINRYVSELQLRGVRAIVVLIHDGAEPRRNDGRLSGPFVQMVEALNPEVDVVVSAHSHQGYAARIGGKLVTQAHSYGSAFADIDLTIDRQTHDVVSSWADIIAVPGSGITPDPEILAIVDDAQARVGPMVTRLVGTASRAITAEQTRTGESALGNLIADAHRWKGGSTIAMTNPGGIRAPLAAGSVTWGELFAIQPFGNELVSMNLLGAQLQSILELQWTAQTDGSERYRPLQVSGIRIVWDGRQPLGQRIVGITLDDGTAVLPNNVYKVTVNSFIAGGGDGFWILNDGFNREYGVVDIDALVDYVEQLPQPFDARIEGRISRLD
ncbi:MAG: bifunctional metallophosphatase/5'-nucleotidase [Chloroflexota bacterium]